MQKKKFIITLLFAVLSIFMITACSDSSNESNSGGNNGGGGTVQPEPDAVKEFYNFNTWQHDRFNYLYSQYAILYDGSLYAWGNNNHGQLGLGITDENVDHKNKKKVNIPDKINQLTATIMGIYDYPTSSDITMSSFYAVTENGELYVWGDNSYGQLGIGNNDNQSIPVKVTGINGKIKNIVTDDVYDLYYAITEDGSLYAWGDNKYGQLGIGSLTTSKNTPSKVNLPGKIKELITGSSVYALMEDGSLYAWGNNEYGQLGVGQSDGTISTPKQVIGINGNIKKLITGSSVYVLMEDDSLYAWGYNYSGELGVGDEVNRNIPTKVNLPSKIKELIIDSSSAYAILEDGSLYTWGKNENGKLGVGDKVNINTPTKVNLPSKIKELIIDSSSAYAILEDGSLYACGDNSDGQLGVGDEINRNTPTKVNLPGKVKELIEYNRSIYTILEDGSLYVWGSNGRGELGVGDEVNRNIPTKVNLSGTIKELIMDSSSTYAILEDGSLDAWGYNGRGELGVGSDEFYIYTPTKVNLPGTIKELINNYGFIYTILEDGSLYAWGSNYKGKLGVGNNEENITIPTLITGITGTIKKVISESHSNDIYFLTEDGLLYGTGLNYSNYPVKIEFKEK